MKLEHQTLFLNAVSQDLSLMRLMSKYIYQPSTKDFSGKNKMWFSLINESIQKGYETINEETLKTLRGLDIEIEKRNHPRTDFLNVMETYKIDKVEIEKNRVIKELENEIEKLKKEKRNVEKTEDMIKNIGKIARSYKWAEIETDGGNLNEMVDVIRMPEVEEIIPTYINGIDELIGGGIYRSGMTIFGAETGGGKSTVMGQSAAMQAINGFKPLILSLELDAKDVFSHTLSVLSQISDLKDREKLDRAYWNLRTIKSQKEAQKMTKQAREVLSDVTGGNLFIEGFKYKTNEALINRIMIAIDSGVDIIYVDNFQNAPFDPSYATKRESLVELADQLEEIAKVHKVAIVALSQITIKKEADGKIERKTAESNQLKKNAENLIFFEQVKEEGAPSAAEMKVIVEKTRFGNGKATEKTLAFFGSLGVVGSISKPSKKVEKNEDFVGVYTGAGQDLEANPNLMEDNDGLPF